jgi:hypothetical protein
MGISFPVYPPADLGKLDHQKRGELKAAIHQVMLHDPEVKKLLKSKTDAVYKALLQRKPTT